MYNRTINGDNIMASKNCMNCGALLDLDAKFCSVCGSAQKMMNPPPTTSVPMYNYANVPVGYNYTPQPNPSIIKVMAIIEIVIGIFGFLGVMVMGYVLYYINKYGITFSYESYNGYMATSSQHMVNVRFISIILAIILILLLIAAICAIVFGVGLYKFRNWGRIGSMVIGGFSLLSFPLGTIFGGVMIYLLTRQENVGLFTPRNNRNSI